MNTSKLHLLIVALVFISACSTKRKDASILATVVEYGTHEPIADVGVLVHYYESGNGFHSKEIPYDSVISNSNGSVFLDGTQYDPVRLKVYSKDSNYFDNRGGGGPIIQVTSGFRRNPTVVIYPYAWAKLRFVKKSDLDYISTQRFSDQLGNFDIKTPDTTLIGRTLGNEWNIITLYPYKNRQALQPYHDSVFTPGHDTTYYEIEW